MTPSPQTRSIQSHTQSGTQSDLKPDVQPDTLQSSFVTLEIPLEDSPGKMEMAIQAALRQWGDPLRWAVMAVDVANQLVKVEAIVTHPLPPEPLLSLG